MPAARNTGVLGLIATLAASYGSSLFTLAALRNTPVVMGSTQKGWPHRGNDIVH
jgi:hypothetical protein